MMLAHQRFLIYPALLLALTGCVSNKSAQSFGRVKDDVAKRSSYAVNWPAKQQMQAKLLEQALGDKKLDADEAVRLALSNNADLQAELDELGIAQAQLMKASLLPNPVLDIGVRFVDGGGGEILELGVAQNLIDILLVPRRKQLAKGDVAMAEQRATAAVLDLAAQVRMAYRGYQAQLARVELYQSVVDATDLSADMAKRLRKAGNITELRKLRELSLHEQSRLKLAEAKGEAMRRREALNALLGLWGKHASGWSVPARLPDPAALALDPAKLEPAVLKKSIDLESARLTINQTARRAGIEKIQTLLPHGEAGAEAEREPSGEWSGGPVVGVSLPVFDIGKGVRAEQAAKLRQALNRYTGLAVRLRASTRSAYTTAQTTANTSRFLREKLLPLQGQVNRQTQLQFNAMQLGVFQLLDAKRGQIATAERYLSSLEDHWSARIRLETLRMGRMPRMRFGIDAGGPLGSSNLSNTTNKDGGH